jgi:diaminopimelate decarboxylase
MDPRQLAARFGTPCYVYDLEVVDRRAAALRAILPDRWDLAFALKANPALAVAGHLAGLGLGADVASEGELETALRAGFRVDRVVFTGPGKRDAELQRAVHLGLRAVTVESSGELARLERFATATGRRVPVLVRLAVDGRTRPERVRLVGDDGAGKFGMDEADALACARRASASSHLDWLGVHAFGASNVLAAGQLAAHVSSTVAKGRAIAAAVGARLRLVDVGGGLGIPYEAGEASLDLRTLGDHLAALDRAWGADPLLRDLRLLLEPGRFLVGPAGAYLTTVVDVKAVGGAVVAITDGGIHHLLRPALVGQAHRLLLYSDRRPSGRSSPVCVAGPLCSGLDVLDPNAILPRPEPGDVIAVLDAGAYGFTEAMPFFLSHPTPAEVAVKDGRAELIRAPITAADVLRQQRQPLW